MSRERCYQFTKIDRLPSDTRLFPEAREHIAQNADSEQPGPQYSRLGPSRKLDQSEAEVHVGQSTQDFNTDTSSGINSNCSSSSCSSIGSISISSSSINNDDDNNNSSGGSSSSNIIDSDTKSMPIRRPHVAAVYRQSKESDRMQVHSFQQGQLIDTNRYRNILRYKLGRSIGQPIVAIETNSEGGNKTKTHQPPQSPALPYTPSLT